MRKYSGLIFALCSFVVCIIIAEIFLWLFAPVPDPYYKYPQKAVNQFIRNEYPPHYRVTTEVEEGLPGIKGKNTFSVNNMGFRGDELVNLKPDNEFRVFISGPSVPECFYLDDSQSLDRVLQNELNKHISSNLSVKVYNAGISGSKSDDQISMIVHRIIHLKPDMIIIFGNTDLHAGINNHDYLHFFEEETSEQKKFPLIRFLATEFQIARRIFYFVKRINPAEQEFMEEISLKSDYKSLVARAQSSPVSDLKPKTNTYPYSLNLRTIIGIAKAHNIKLVFTITQNTWNSSIDPEIKNWHWSLYSIKEKIRFREDIMYEAKEEYDNVMIQLSDEYSVPILDLRKTMPKTLEFFYDDGHFNVKGADLAGKQLAAYIIQEGLVSR